LAVQNDESDLTHVLDIAAKVTVMTALAQKAKDQMVAEVRFRRFRP
jgi:hypothetical protein